ERLVPEVADLRALRVDVEPAVGRDRKSGADTQEGRLTRSVRAGDDREPAAFDVEVDGAQDSLLAERLAERAGGDHVTASAMTQTAKATLIAPFMVKKAASRRRRSSVRTSECS